MHSFSQPKTMLAIKKNVQDVCTLLLLLVSMSKMSTADAVHAVFVFSHFELADKASSLPHEQRKVHAEKVNHCIHQTKHKD